MSKKSINKPKTQSVPSAELARLEDLLKLMGKYGASEIEYEDDRARVKLRIGGMPSATPAMVSAPAASAPSPASPSKPAGPSANQKPIVSPFVGTFYRSASPTSEAYVKEGQSVKKGQTLCIVEAMKLMNEIESEFNGKIVKVLVENGQPVEFGEPLFLIEV